jgi:hypothetical protein
MESGLKTYYFEAAGSKVWKLLQVRVSATSGSEETMEEEAI